MKTALELLVEQLPIRIVNSYQSEIAKAIEIEKKQIINAHGNQQKKSGGITNYTYILTGEEYYNENFKNK